MSSEKTKNIVVFGANGGIGEDVLRRLADEVQKGKDYRISIVTRKGEKYANAKVMELLETMDFSQDIRGDLVKALDHDKHANFDGKNDGVLKPLLEDADMVISAAGLPRPNPPPPRAALIYPNSKVVEQAVDAMAKYAPADTPLLLGTNPLDNTVQIANDRFKQKWKEFGKESEKGALPDVKVFGMAGTLDETRLKIYTARLVNQALRAQGGEPKDGIQPKDVDGRVYGQHGPKMVVDIGSITVKEKSGNTVALDRFLDNHNIRDAEVKITTSKGEEKTLPIKQAIEAETIDGGAKVITGIGRSTQSGAGKRIVELVDDYFSDNKKTVTAAVVKDGVASGNLIEIGGREISVRELPSHITPDSELGQKVQASIAEIQKDHRVYEDAVKAEKVLMPILGGNVTISMVARGGKEKNVTIKPKDGNVVAIASDNVQKVRESLAKVIGIEEDKIDISDVSSATPAIQFPISESQKPSLDTLAESLGTKVSHGKGNDVQKQATSPQAPSTIVLDTNTTKALEDKSQQR